MERHGGLQGTAVSFKTRCKRDFNGKDKVKRVT